MRSRIAAFLLCMLCILCLAGCASNEDPEPTVPQWKWLREKAEYLTVIATEDDLLLLDECINLEYLDLTGSTCYDAILDYVARHPNVEVVYTAPLGDRIFSNSEVEAALEPGTYDLAALQKQLKYLPGLKNLVLPRTHLTPSELTELQASCPNVKVVYSVELMGEEYLTDTTRLDLSRLTAQDLVDVLEVLPMLPDLQYVELMGPSGSNLAPADVRQVMNALPGVSVHYTFDLFGQTLSTTDERVEFNGVKMGDEAQSRIREALDILPDCTYFRLENCGFSNQTLGAIQADYPNTKIVWRVNFGGQYSLTTDETTLRAVYGVENSHNDVLKYCTSLKYIDMGHNTTLTDISFTAYMPDLEILILSGSPIRNVDPLANCKNLVFLELANCNALEDISALENCEKLRFLNVGFSQVKDLTPIEDLPLERFICLGPKMDKETQAAFEENHPDCWVRFTGNNPLSLGWKYDDIGETYSEYYKFIRQIFNLDEVDRRLAQQAAEEEARREQEEAANRPTDPPADPTPPPVTEPAPPPATDPPAPEPAPET